MVLERKKMFSTTMIGSFPHKHSLPLCEQLITRLDIPIWPQLPRRDFRESIYVQFSPSLPGVVVDMANEKVHFETENGFLEAMEKFYERYLAEDLNYFGLKTDYAQGFFAVHELLKTTPKNWVKGHVIGPISFGLTVTDQNLRAALYNEMLADVLPKGIAMQARWQVQKLKEVCPEVILFVDEPYMASFGSAYVNLTREQAIAMMDEVFLAIQAENAQAGVHCCANTDWSVLLATSVNILNLDAYGFQSNLALYSAELKTFLDKGGRIAWGIVPNDEAIMGITPVELVAKLHSGFEQIVRRAAARGISIEIETLQEQSLVTPSCGLGSTTENIAAVVMDMLVETAALLKKT